MFAKINALKVMFITITSLFREVKLITTLIINTLLTLITPALSQRRPILRRPLFRQEQISTYRHLGPLLTSR